jgi:hypothetical protein
VKELIMEMLWKPGKEILLSFLYVVLFCLASSIGSKATAAEGNAKALTDCDIQLGPCTKVKDTLAVTLDIFPKPVKAMKELTFRLTLTGKESPDNLYIDLTMPGMVMGPNRVTMKGVGGHTYEGQGVIVRCPSGRRTWKAMVILPNAGVVDFVFDVVY